MRNASQNGARIRGLWREAKPMLGALVLCFLLQATLAQAYHIPSGSMENTLRAGDVLLADKLTFGTPIQSAKIVNLITEVNAPSYRT